MANISYIRKNLCSKRIESLVQENNRLSSALEKIKLTSQTGLSVNENVEDLEQKCVVLKSENDQLISEVFALKQKLIDLGVKYDVVKTENNEVSVERPSTSEESPVLFRGFTSSGDDLFEVSPIVNLLFESKTSSQTKHNEGKSLSNKGDFFDNITQENTESRASSDKTSALKLELVAPLLSERDKEQEGGIVEEMNNLRMVLQEKESQLASLNERFVILEKENWNLKQKTEENLSKSLWGTDTSTPKEIATHWGEDLNPLSKQLEEKDSKINNLEAQLTCKSRDLFQAQNENHQNDTNNVNNDSFSNLFSQSEDSQEGKINEFVEQITQLTKTLHDKEIEVETLTDKKNKYKEMYLTLAKDYDMPSRDQSNPDKDQLTDQNVMLNQLLDHKESELEIMSQQIDQTMVARENLQEELCLKLSEMEAANKSYNSPKFPKEILISSSQPENIEDVRTLCAEVAELNKLLQEKESEVEILKQQLDESNLEKENLIDEWKKEIEIYKEKSSNDSSKDEVMRRELESFKDGFVADIEKQHKDELSLKDQQLMNAINDLRNTHSYCQDLKDKLNELENKLKDCNEQNELLIKELNNFKQTEENLWPLLQGAGDRPEMSLLERVQWLKNNFSELNDRFEEARLEIEDKDKTITALKDKFKTLETVVGSEERSVIEHQPQPSQVRSFASEPFRISTEQSSSDDDSSYRNTEHIQNQMLTKEIESMKQVLSMKDTEITRLSIALNDAQENLIRGELRFINSEEENLRQRLDEALYTLHLRDVRCDELALELMQLLEERDSLQLRLSNAIRFNEELRSKSKQLDEAALRMEGEVLALAPFPEPDPTDHQLKQKLDQLHNVGYRRDPAMQQDQQRRHQEQMHLYTQHPPQDDSQSAGGFFNWIFGSSPSSSQDI